MSRELEGCLEAPNFTANGFGESVLGLADWGQAGLPGPLSTKLFFKTQVI